MTIIRYLPDLNCDTIDLIKIILRDPIAAMFANACVTAKYRHIAIRGDIVYNFVNDDLAIYQLINYTSPRVSSDISAAIPFFSILFAANINKNIVGEVIAAIALC